MKELAEKKAQQEKAALVRKNDIEMHYQNKNNRRNGAGAYIGINGSDKQRNAKSNVTGGHNSTNASNDNDSNEKRGSYKNDIAP